MSRPRVLLLLVSAGLSLAALCPSSILADEPLKDFHTYVEKALKEWEVPGLALAVVKDDKVVIAKGYGVRKLGEPMPVDPHTVFAIGSISKSFTATALGLLVDEGKIKWDDPIAKHFPAFQMNDAYVNKEMTLRDLLSHRSGLDRHEYIWYGSGRNRAEVLQRLRQVKPDWSFRGKFGYQNMMYLAAAETIPAVTKKSWDDFVRDRIFKPLGMNESNTSVTQLSLSQNVASPHQKIEEKVQVIPWRNIDNIGGAGSINSNVLDMAQYIRLHLAEGKWDKKQLLSSGVVKEMQTAQTVIPITSASTKQNPYTHLSAYGLGWMLQDYRGKLLVQHGGGIDGMISQLAMVPEEKLGLIILSNRTGNALPSALMYWIVDYYLKAAPRDWSAELLKTVKAAEDLGKKAEKKQESERVKDTKPSLALDKYAGTYKNDVYGDVKITLAKGAEKGKEKLVLQFGPNFFFDLGHWHFDTFQAISREPAKDKRLITFTLDSKGKVADVKLAEQGETDLVFKKSADGPDATPILAMKEDELKKFVGKYELKNPPLEISIELVSAKLQAMVPGQPALTIVPIKPTRFKLETGPAGFFAEFALADGKVKSMTLEQPSSPSITLDRK